jgi:uncharacterized protein (TIGR00369 family)
MTIAATPPFVAHVGVRDTDAAVGFASSEVRLAPHHLNRAGSAHGGLIATLLDTTMSRIALLTCGSDGRVVTVEIKVSFVAPGRGTLHCKAWPTNRTASLIYLEGEVRDATGLLVARGSATFKHRIKP